MAQTETETWRDRMLEIELTEAGIPVYDHDSQASKGVTVRGMDGALYIFCYDTHEAFGILAYDWRVDLEERQGFGYALQVAPRPVRWVANWMNGRTTDGDRLGVAVALAEKFGVRCDEAGCSRFVLEGGLHVVFVDKSLFPERHVCEGCLKNYDDEGQPLAA